MTTKRKHALANGRRYTDAEKALAIQTLLVSGGVSQDSLRSVRMLLKSKALSEKTLVSWLKERTASQLSDLQKNPSSQTETQVAQFNEKAAALDQWKQTRIAYLKRANSSQAINLTDGKDAVAAAERAQKMEQLLSGMPTEILEAGPVLTELADFLRAQNVNFTESQRQFLYMLKAKQAAANIEQSGDAA